MSRSREKAIDRVRKLLSMAAENSGATKSERESAAKMAAEIIEQYTITEDERAPLSTRRRPHPPRTDHRPPPPPTDIVYEWDGYNYISPPEPPPGMGWVKHRSNITTTCGSCGGTLYAGDKSYYNTNIGCYRHYRASCTQKAYGQ